jgi:hypothetical protein
MSIVNCREEEMMRRGRERERERIVRAGMEENGFYDDGLGQTGVAG